MRLTVGPLPPAVYWRRRAVVLGAGMLFLIVLLYSCSGPGGTDEPGQDRAGNPGPTTGATPTTPVLTPESGAPDDGQSDAPAGEASGEPAAGDSTAGAQVPPPAAPVDGGCTDEEMSVIPVPSQTSAKRGEPIELKLKIKNASNRTCSRDVGADVQELFIKVGARKVWSSDVCSTVRATDVRSFPPGLENEYTISWNGRESSKCANGLANGPYPAAGTYQLFGRLDTKHSDPVKLTITG